MANGSGCAVNDFHLPELAATHFAMARMQMHCLRSGISTQLFSAKRINFAKWKILHFHASDVARTEKPLQTDGKMGHSHLS